MLTLIPALRIFESYNPPYTTGDLDGNHERTFTTTSTHTDTAPVTDS